MIIINSIPRSFLVSKVSSRMRSELWELLENVYPFKNENILYCLPDKTFLPELSNSIGKEIKNRIILHFSRRKLFLQHKKIELIVIDGAHLFSFEELIFLLQLQLPIIFLLPYSLEHFLCERFFYKLKGFGVSLPILSQNIFQRVLNRFRKKIFDPGLIQYVHCVSYLYSLGLRSFLKKNNALWLLMRVKYKKDNFLKNYARN